MTHIHIFKKNLSISMREGTRGYRDPQSEFNIVLCLYSSGNSRISRIRQKEKEREMKERKREKEIERKRNREKEREREREKERERDRKRDIR